MLRKYDLKFPLFGRVCLEPLSETNRHPAKLELVILYPMPDRHQVGLAYCLVDLILIKGPGPFYGVNKNLYL